MAAELRELLQDRPIGLSGQESPFRGLLPFTERQAGLFFGRDAEIAAFVERVRLHPVLPVVGPSGAGKSSFVQAGVIPRLQEQESWIILRLRPGSRPLHALAEETFDAASSRASREQRMMTMAEGIGPFVEELSENLAGELEGQTIGNAAGVKLKDADLVPMRQYIARQLKLTQRNAADEVKREQREQREDPTIAKRFADAIEQVQAERNDPTAFATIASRAGIEATNDLEQLDIEDYIRGAAKAAADNIATKIQSAARAAVQTAAAAGGATMDAIRAAVAIAVTPQVLLGEVQAPVQGTYSIGRETQLKREDVALILYTNTPELSSQVCDVCLDTAASPDNPYPANDTALDAMFQTPNPGCLGALAGRGNPCWCARIGITGAASPEDIRRAV